MSSKQIKVFKAFPIELLRVNNGLSIKLRQHAPGKRRYDVTTEDGIVRAKAMDATTYEAPNGASLRPNSVFQQNLIRRFNARDAVVFTIPAGTPLPHDLVLVHEHMDHYSLQGARDMPLPELNDKLTGFMEAYATVLSKESWLRAFRAAAAAGQGKQQA